MNKIILIDEHKPSGFFWPNLEKNNKIPSLTVKEILNKYKGFEGELREIYNLRKNDPDLETAYNLFLETSKLNQLKILYVGSAPSGSIPLDFFRKSL